MPPSSVSGGPDYGRAHLRGPKELPRATVVVLDDDPGVLRSVSRLLRQHGYHAVSYSSPGLLLSEIVSLDPSCLIVDLAMPELSGLEVQREVVARCPYLPAVFITGHGDVRSSVQAMREGAVDFLTKPFDSTELLDAVSEAIAKNRHVREFEERRGRVLRRVASLTPRELEVFRQVVSGLLNKQIAANLGIAEKTVKVHRGRVMRKMAVRSVANLVRAAEWMETGDTPHSV